MRLGKLGLFPSQATFCPGDGRACPDEVRFELGNHCQDVEQESTDGIGGVVDGAVDAQLDLAVSEVIDNVFRVPQRSGVCPAAEQWLALSGTVDLTVFPT